MTRIWSEHAIRTGALALVAVLLVACVAVPPGIVVLGVVMGSLNALLAVGLVLVHRVGRIINFAHGETGASAAVLTVLLVVDGWNYFAAVAVGILVAFSVGVLTEMVVLRRFHDAPRLIVTVVTIALAQVLSAISLVLPLLFDKPVVPTRFRTPLSRFELRIDPVIFNGNHLLVIVVAVLAVVGITVFFRRTRFGIASRAAAENEERAALCGVPVRSVSTLIWGLAAVLSAVAAILQAPIVGLTIGRLVGPGLLVRGLAAAVLARMESVIAAIAAAIAIGVFEQAVFFRSGRSPVVDVLLLVVIVAGLLLQRPERRRTDPSDASTWEAVGHVRPIPAVLRNLPEVRLGRIAAVGGAVLLAIGIPALLMSGPSQNLSASVVIWALVGVSLVVLSGWGGQVSLGQFALVGVGAAAAGSLAVEAGWDAIYALGGGAAVGMAAAIVLGLPALRLRGFFLAVTTLGFAVATDSYLLPLDWVSPDGIVERPVLFSRIDLENELHYYWFCLAVLALVITGLRGLRRSRLGRAIVAVRDNERCAQSFGIRATTAKLGAFAVSGAIAGLAGGLFVYHQHRLNADQYAPVRSLEAFTMSAIGGLGSIPGAIAGALYVRGMQDILRSPYSILATGLGLVLVLLIFPRGFGSIIFAVRDAILRRMARRRRLAIPALDGHSQSSPDTVDVTEPPQPTATSREPTVVR